MLSQKLGHEMQTAVGQKTELATTADPYLHKHAVNKLAIFTQHCFCYPAVAQSDLCVLLGPLTCIMVQHIPGSLVVWRSVI